MNRHQRGLSLLETIAALFLLSMVAILLLNLFPTSIASVKQSEQRVQGDLIAQSLLADKSTANFDDLTVGTTESPPDLQIDGVTYRRRIEYLAVPGSDPDLLKSVKATVEWEVHNISRNSVHEVRLAKVNH